MNSKNIAIFGGAFDPPHNGHLEVVTALSKLKEFDEVWIVPSGRRRKSDKIYWSNDKDRLQRIKIFSENFSDINVSLNLIELEEKDKIIGTYKLYCALNKLYPDYKFKFIIGSDLLKELPNWLHQEDLKREVNFSVYTRPGETSPSNLDLPTGFNIEILELNLKLNISSSQIRKMIQLGENIKDLVPDNIRMNIRKNL